MRTVLCSSRRLTVTDSSLVSPGLVLGSRLCIQRSRLHELHGGNMTCPMLKYLREKVQIGFGWSGESGSGGGRWKSLGLSSASVVLRAHK